MTSEQISEHIEKFKDGASFVMTKKSFEKFVQNFSTIGRPNGLFVMPKTECDRIAAKAGNNLAIYEKELGFEEGAFSAGDGMVRFDVTNFEKLKELHIRVPSGNEGGANELWLPGGYTSGGVPEAVIDQIKKSDTIMTMIGVK